MKHTGKLLLASLLAIMIVLPFVMATPVLETIGTTIFGFSDTFSQPNLVVIQLMIWLILFVAFADILEVVFSDITRWIIGFGLAVIAANAGWVSQLNSYMFEATAALGSFSVAAVIGITFVAFLLAHFGLGWAVSWITNAKRIKALREAKFKIKAGANALAEVGEEMEHIGRPKQIIQWIIIAIVVLLLIVMIAKAK